MYRFQYGLQGEWAHSFIERDSLIFLRINEVNLAFKVSFPFFQDILPTIPKLNEKLYGSPRVDVSFAKTAPLPAQDATCLSLFLVHFFLHLSLCRN